MSICGELDPPRERRRQILHEVGGSVGIAGAEASMITARRQMVVGSTLVVAPRTLECEHKSAFRIVQRTGSGLASGTPAEEHPPECCG